MAGRKRRAHAWRLSDEQRVEVERLIAAGETQEVAATAVGCDVRTVIRSIMRTGGLRSYERRRSSLRLSLAEREQIAIGVARGDSARSIAERLGRAPSTITRELGSNGGRNGYWACDADAQALVNARRPKVAKLASCPRLRAIVEDGLEKCWSPEQISARLKIDYPDDA